MSVVLRKTFQEYRIRWWNEPRTEDDVYTFRDRFAAMCFLRRFAFHPRNVVALRNLLTEDRSLYMLGRLSDRQILRETAIRLIDGRLVITVRLLESRWELASDERGEARLSEFAPRTRAPKAEPARRDPATPRPGQEPTFPTDIAPDFIARAMKESARLGIPFCEECVRKALSPR